MAKILIRLKTLRCGPTGTVTPGSVLSEDEDTAKYLVKTGQAEWVNGPVIETADQELQIEKAVNNGFMKFVKKSK